MSAVLDRSGPARHPAGPTRMVPCRDADGLLVGFEMTSEVVVITLPKDDAIGIARFILEQTHEVL